jgi:hypothetical protein
MVKGIRLFLSAFLFALIGMPSLASSNQCDCTQVVGTCSGAVEVTKSFGSSPSFGAEIAIYSSEKICSKVEYFVDSTPYQTLLVNRTKESESVFGTKPVGAKNVRFSACYVCKSDSANNQGGGGGGTGALAGRWTGTVECPWGSGDLALNLNFTGGSYQFSGQSGNTSVQGGSINGDSIEFTETNWANTVSYTGRIQAPNKMGGTYTQTSKAGTCRWNLTKVGG